MFVVFRYLFGDFINNKPKGLHVRLKCGNEDVFWCQWCLVVRVMLSLSLSFCGGVVCVCVAQFENYTLLGVHIIISLSRSQPPTLSLSEERESEREGRVE